jgi:hypothetical protein
MVALHCDVAPGVTVDGAQATEIEEIVGDPETDWLVEVPQVVAASRTKLAMAVCGRRFFKVLLLKLSCKLLI